MSKSLKVPTPFPACCAGRSLDAQSPKRVDVGARHRIAEGSLTAFGVRFNPADRPQSDRGGGHKIAERFGVRLNLADSSRTALGVRHNIAERSQTELGVRLDFADGPESTAEPGLNGQLEGCLVDVGSIGASHKF